MKLEPDFCYHTLLHQTTLSPFSISYISQAGSTSYTSPLLALPVFETSCKIIIECMKGEKKFCHLIRRHRTWVLHNIDYPDQDPLDLDLFLQFSFISRWTCFEHLDSLGVCPILDLSEDPLKERVQYRCRQKRFDYPAVRTLSGLEHGDGSRQYMGAPFQHQLLRSMASLPSRNHQINIFHDFFSWLMLLRGMLDILKNPGIIFFKILGLGYPEIQLEHVLPAK